jgi:nitroreductase
MCDKVRLTLYLARAGMHVNAQRGRQRAQGAIIASTDVTTDVTPTQAELDLTAVLHRRSTGKLTEPGPGDADLAAMLEVACTAPDHGKLRPWRFIVLRGRALEELGASFARAQSAKTPDASPTELDSIARKALRAPVIVTVVGRTTPHPKVRPWEQLVAAGCAAQNLCIAATAYGFGSMWRTGWLAEHPEVLAHLGVDERERVVGFVYLGTVVDGFQPAPREVDASCVSWRDGVGLDRAEVAQPECADEGYPAVRR